MTRNAGNHLFQVGDERFSFLAVGRCVLGRTEPMDDHKCRTLKAGLAAQPEPQIVAAQQFFDGNDDCRSIGGNLTEHPGVDVFRDTFFALLCRPDVDAVYTQIAKADPGDRCWPITDTVLVVGTIPPDALRDAVSALQPDEVGDPAQLGIAPEITGRHGSHVLAARWKDSPTKNRRFQVMGSVIEYSGWALFWGSIFFALGAKGSDSDLFGYLFYSSVAVLVVVAAAYLIARPVSASWRTKALRSYFSPYICGAIIWITLIVLLSSLSG